MSNTNSLTENKISKSNHSQNEEDTQNVQLQSTTQNSLEDNANEVEIKDHLQNEEEIQNAQLKITTQNSFIDNAIKGAIKDSKEVVLDVQSLSNDCGYEKTKRFMLNHYYGKRLKTWVFYNAGGQGPPVYGGQPPPVYGGQAPPVYGGQAPPVYGGQAPPVYGGHGPPVYGGEAESEDEGSLQYNPATRNSFVRFVFTILLVMIVCTAAITCMIMFIKPIRRFFRAYGVFLALPAMMVVICLNYAMSCSSCTRRPPCNFICLILTVIAMSIDCGYITCRYKTNLVLYAVVATTIVVFVCFLLACSKFDFTKWTLYIVMASTAIGVISIIFAVVKLTTGIYLTPLELALLAAGTLMNVVTLAMELQMVLGGRTVSIGEDDYAYAAFLLYCSIIHVFMKMLRMAGLIENLINREE